MRAYRSNTYRFRIMNYLFYACTIPSRSLRIMGNSVVAVQKAVRNMAQNGWVKNEKIFGKRYVTIAKPLSHYRSQEDHFFENYNGYFARLRDSFFRKEVNSKNKQKMQRLTQLAESSIFVGEAGIDVIPGTKPCLQFLKAYWEAPAFYQSLEIKELMAEDESRATGSRSTGCICWKNEVATVFSLSDDIVKIGEITEKLHVERLYGFFAEKVGEVHVEDTYLFTWKYNKVHGKLSLKSQYASFFYLDDTYKNYYLIPYSMTGRELLELLFMPNAKEELQNMLIRKEWQTKGNTDIEVDGIDENGVYLFNYLVPNIYRLKKFINAAKRLKHKEFHVYCYDFQEEAVREELTSNMTCSVYEFATVKELYIKRMERRVADAEG